MGWRLRSWIAAGQRMRREFARLPHLRLVCLASNVSLEHAGFNEIGPMAVLNLLRVLLGAFYLFAISVMPVFAAELAFVVGVDRYDNLAPHA